MKKDEKNLYEAVLTLGSKEEAYAFFRDLCTPAEIDAMVERWRVAQVLYKGEHSYREIHALTGSSISTIGRVARFLNQENYKGYQTILERISKKDKK
jgi:TrpR-related protein YerC/YecD